MAKAGLATSPPVPVPRPLVPFVRFSKLSDRAVATVRRVLEDDQAFRDHVRDAVELAGLAAALDEPSLLFLRRPEGWQEALDAHVAAAVEADAVAAAERAEAAAVRQLEVAQAALARTEAQLAPMRAEVAALRSQVGDERRARRTAESDLGRLRKRVAALEAEPDRHITSSSPEGEGEVAALTAVAAGEARAHEALAIAAHERDRADAAERALAVAEAAAHAAATAPPLPEGVAERGVAAAAVADAVSAVGALADALGRAARELAPPSGSGDRSSPPPGMAERRRVDRGSGGRRAPAGGSDRGRSPVPLPPAVFEDAPEAVDHLLRVPRALVLVDGYNVTLSARGELALPDQRRWLLDAAAGVAARTGATFHVVFDGDAVASAPADRSRRLGVHVRFTAAGVEADDLLLALVDELPRDHPTVVVSDDRRVRDGARRRGANVVGAAQLVEALRR